jgi:TonB family protein
MNAYLNYLLEANLVLLLAYALYLAILKGETDFSMKRLFLVGSVIAAVSFPMLHFSLPSRPLPSLGTLLTAKLLPEVSVTFGSDNMTGPSIIPVWTTVKYLYITGASVSLIIFLARLTGLFSTLMRARTQAFGKFRIATAPVNAPSFSFFHFIFLGQAENLSQDEREQIIRHEMVHAKRLHSFDILLLNVTAILFWFNPIIYRYKKTFTHLHEFEADARAIAGHEVNDYCSLLAKVALLSADIKLASHFNNSLTLKRITMMRTLKRSVRRWKLAAIAVTTTIIFLFVACQDQLISEVQNLSKSSNMAIDIPEEVQHRIDEIKNAHPEKKFVVIETTTDEGWKTLEKIQQNNVAHIELITPTAKPSETVRSFAVVEMNEMTEKVTALSQQEGEVYTVVDETALPEGGMPAFYEYVMTNLKYPKAAREKGEEGKVLVEFVVQTDGSITDVAILKGVSEDLNHEAMKVMAGSPRWVPGKMQGKLVKQRMVMPISFKLGDSKTNDEASAPKADLSEVVVVGQQK